MPAALSDVRGRGEGALGNPDATMSATSKPRRRARSAALLVAAIAVLAALGVAPASAGYDPIGGGSVKLTVEHGA